MGKAGSGDHGSDQGQGRRHLAEDVGGWYHHPLEVITQLTYLMFIRSLDSRLFDDGRQKRLVRLINQVKANALSPVA